MILELIIVIFQSISVVALALIGILEVTKYPDDGLNKLGWRVLFIAVVIYISSTSTLHLLTTRAEKDLINRIKQMQEVLLEQVMESPMQARPITPTQNPVADLRIQKPLSGEVNWRPYVEGIVSDPKSKVWVIIHPVGLRSFWVQPPVSVNRDGSWRVKVYIGRAGQIDIGKEFEIMAVSRPKQQLNEGRILSEWPDVGWRSEIVTVVRK